MTPARAVALSAALLTACCALQGQYTYYYTDTLTSINTSNWTENGTLTAGSGGLTSSNSNGGSLISKVSVPDGSSNYEVKTTLTLTASGGTYAIYLRGSSNAMSGPAAAGTSYAFEIQNPTFSGSACSATLAVYKIISGSVTSISSTTVPCNNGMTVRAIYTAISNQIVLYLNNGYYFWTEDSSIASGQPGIGVRNAPSGNSIAKVQLGGIYAGSPTMPPTSQIGVTPFYNQVQMQWPGAAEPNGPGIAFYEVFRNSTYLDSITEEAFVDPSVSYNTTYSYQITAVDFDLNEASTTVSIETPPDGAIDARETGVRPTGSYWGGGGEEIDMLSGNLNYTTPMIKAMGRGGWSVGFNLTYNSQNWRKDPGGTWQLGQDVGYGYGWKLLAGSLLPLENPDYAIGEYLFTDATGAQYHLNQNNSGIWTSLESIYVYYNANTGVLYFANGSFWVMGCISAGTEWDAGTMYPTTMEDTNGNQIFIVYEDGVGVTWNNSSSRIATIEDVRGNGSPDYTFTYYSDAIPHLKDITNNIGTSENYSFTYTEGYALTDPYAGSSFGAVALLASSTVTGIPLTTYYTYDTTSATTSCSSVGTGTSGSGQLTQVTTPYCGHLRWTYTTTTANTLYGSRIYNEVQNRFLSMASGATETEVSLVRGNDSSYTVHSAATLQDSPSNAEKIWTFQVSTSSPYLGLETSYEEATFPSGTGLSLLNFTWAQTPTSSNPYIQTTVTTLNPGASQSAKQTVQTLDQYGNLLTQQVYNFISSGGSFGSPARTYTNTYLSSSNYTSQYIFNRLVSSTVTDGINTALLAQNLYDNQTNFSYCPYILSLTNITSQHEHDAAYGTSFVYRGDVFISVTPTTTTCSELDIDGNPVNSLVNGVESTVTNSSTNNYAVPSQITTNSLTSTMNWSGFLGLSSATGPNGDTGSINYDSNARPTTTVSPYGATTYYTYNDSSSPPNKLAMTNSHGSKTVMDGFARTIQTITGYGSSSSISTTISTVDTQYAPCGCSPLGKLYRQSQPYAPGGTDAWTTYTYDASGRTLSVALPDGSTTTYTYGGNQVVVRDPAGITKSFTMDAFGNLVTVGEIDPSLGLVLTNYTYDVMNHLIGVSMTRGSTTQTRTFNYNPSSTPTTVTAFLQSATNPENGTVSYTYNATSNTLATKTDAKGQQFNYSYDSYNRLTSVSVGSSSPTTLRTYYYDTNPLQSGFSNYSAGRLTAVQYPSQSGVQMNDMYNYTQPGQVATKRLQVNEPYVYYVGSTRETTTLTQNLDSGFNYNNEGKITAMTYPSTDSDNTVTVGPSYNYSYDSMYRLSGMTTGSTTIVNGVSYNAANQLLGMTFNSMIETRGYNSLNQLVSLSDGYSYESYVSLTYTYPTGSNNGKLSSTYNAISGETVTYTYDSLNRLATATGSGWGESYGFDSFGNLLSKTVTTGSGPSLSQTVNPANNEIETYSYDANGNQESIYNGTTLYGLNYDPENRLSGISYESMGQADYFYDAQNRRIWSWVPGTTDSWGNTTNYTVNIYTPTGQKLGAYTLAPSLYEYEGAYTPFMSVTLSSSDQYFGARRLAPMDQLGSAALNGSGFAQSFYPWGENRGSNIPQNAWGFATHWEDSLTGLDYSMNRYYSNAYGRFMTPDAAPRSRLGDPQSWNRYAYTRGDPVNRLDPSGRDDESTCTLTSSDFCITDTESGGDGWSWSWGDPLDGLTPTAEEGCLAALEQCEQAIATAQQGQGESLYSALAAAQLTASAPGATQSQQQALNAALNAAWAHIISNPGCANFLTNYSEPITEAWGQLGTILTNTTYQFGSLKSGTAAQTTEGGNQVTINTSGAFGSGSGSGIVIVTTATSQYLFNNIVAADAMILLHELGHETSVLPTDTTNSSQNATNTANIVTNCFTKMANGVYQ